MGRLLIAGALALVLAAVAAALAFTPYLPFFGGGAAATAETGTPTLLGAAAWWEPSRGYVTNAGIATLVNLTAAGSAYDLTNAAGASSPALQTSVLNGFNGLSFAGGQLLTSSAYSTSTRTQVVFLVMAFTNVNGTYWYDSMDISNRQALLNSSGPPDRFNMQFSGLGAISGAVTTNQYIAMAVAFPDHDAGLLRVYTNSVNAVANVGAGTGTNTVSGFRLGAHIGGTNQARMSFVSGFIFTNGNVTAAVLSNAWYYCSNRFHLP